MSDSVKMIGGRIPKLLAVAGLLFGIALMVWLKLNFDQPWTYYSWKHSAVFYFGLICIATGVCEVILPYLTEKRGASVAEARLFVFAILIGLGLSEIILRVSGIHQTYSEMRSGLFAPVYDRGGQDIYRTWSANDEHRLSSPEFDYPRKANSLGFSDTEFVPVAADSLVLIQTYGDSFTEGDGAPSDSSYPALLKQLLQDRNIRAVVQNFGVCGNDPGFYLPQFRDIGARFHPQVVVMTYGTGDLMGDMITRGGLERFKENGWTGRQGPWFEWIYACSYVARAVCSGLFGIQHANFLLTQQGYADSIKTLEPLWNWIFTAIAINARQHDVKVILIKRPERHEIENDRYVYDFTFFDDLIDTMEIFSHFDLLPYYRDSIGMDGSNSHEFFWPKDGHHNGLGYEQMARGVFVALETKDSELLRPDRSIKKVR